MRLIDLHIDGFGKFHDLDVRFEDGLNVVYGRNEAGKSTLHTFIRCMLFGLERGRGRASKNDLYSRYEPWQNRALYGGRLRLEKDGTVYRIERIFQKEQKSLTIVNETSGKKVDPTPAFMDSLLGGLTETTYNNTISIGQLKSATDGGMVAELRNYIANMNTSGNMALNITKATAHLKAKRKEFERQLVPEAARSYTALISEIHSLEKEIAAPEYENQLGAYQNIRSQVKSLLTEKQEEREALLQKISRGRQALSGAQFTDEASIDAYRRETRETFQKYEALTRDSQSGWRTLAAAAVCILAVLTGVAAILAFLQNIQAFPLVGTLDILTRLFGNASGIAAALLAILCGLFLVAGIFLLVKDKSLKKDAAMLSKILQETFSRHLGDSAISEEAMQAFEARMDEYLRLSQVLVRSEQSAKEEEAAIASLKEREVTCDDAISRQQRSQWELEKKLDRMTSCKDQVETLKTTLAENERIREEISAIDLALDTMTELSGTIRSSFGLYLNKTASDLVSGITGGIYDSISVDENLNLFLNTPTKLIPVDQVSSGAMDQVYLALRLSAARLIQGNDASGQMPLIFDDSFVLYDDERLRTALRWLTQTFDCQIIMFTCHRREAQMLTAEQIPYHLISI
ncbi:MAG: AAA family ATPase [Clostridiales bacterium]|nr:AAA family ATPase [Clostridiales bacterium]